MLPNCVIIGAAKCGTTSLHYYLGQHPDVFMSREKELYFFASEKRWSQGVEWYESQFPDRGKKVYGEASTGYSAYPQYENVPGRMASVIPAAKLIYLVRDPVARILSEYQYLCWTGRETRPFGKAVSAPAPNRYIDRSSYMMQLDRFRPYFPASQIRVVDADDLKNNRSAALAAIFRFLDVAAFDSPSFAQQRNETLSHMRRKPPTQAAVLAMNRLLGGQLSRAIRRRVPQSVLRRLATPISAPHVDDELRARLIERLQPDADGLRAYTGLRFPGWQL